MTELITTAPIANRFPSLPRTSFPKLGVGAALAATARAVGQAFTAVGQAFTLAYIDPFTGPRLHDPAGSDEYLGGRDPRW